MRMSNVECGMSNDTSGCNQPNLGAPSFAIRHSPFATSLWGDR